MQASATITASYTIKFLHQQLLHNRASAERTVTQ